MLKNTCFYEHSEHVNFAVQGSFLASPSLLHKELTHESNRLSSRNLINQTSCLSTRVHGCYDALFRRWCYFIRNGRNPFRNPEYLTQVMIWIQNSATKLVSSRNTQPTIQQAFAHLEQYPKRACRKETLSPSAMDVIFATPHS